MKEDLPFYSDPVPFLLQNDEIKWIIGFIRNILEEIPEQISCSLTIMEEQKLYLYQEKKKQLLDFLRTVESFIELNRRKKEQENMEYRSFEIFNETHTNKQESVQTDRKEVIRKTNPSIESMNNYHKLTRIFCALVSCSAYAMFLNCEVSAIGKKANETVLAEIENNKPLLDGLKKIENICAELKKSQEQIDRRIIRHDDKSSRAQNDLDKKITKRNKVESRCELTQIDCAIIIEKKRKVIDDEKIRLLESLKLETDRIKIIDTEEKREKRIKNIARTIGRWDTGETKPPAGYSRRISEYEFSNWVDIVEKKKLEKWKERIRKRIKGISLDSVEEEELHKWMELDR